MKATISVVIPVYKTEAYLKACIDSVLQQTYEDLDIILVDDGSPDHCPEICDAYAAEESRVTVIHQKNQGLSAARNAGIAAAKGEFLAFLDSDDVWSPYFAEQLLTALQEHNADMAVCGMTRFTGEANMPAEAGTPAICLTQAEGYNCLFDERNEAMVPASNKLYRRELFAQVRYPVGKLHEDEAVIHEIIGRCQSIAWVEQKLYYYRQTENSITTARFHLKRLDEMEAKEKRIAYFEARGLHHLAERTRVVYLSNLMRLYRTVQNELDDRAERKQTCIRLYHRFCDIYTKELVGSASQSMRIRCLLFRCFPKVFSKLEYKRLERKKYNV